MNISIIIIQIVQALLLIFIAPVFLGWVKQNRAWLANKKGAGLLQPFRNIRKLLAKEPAVATNTSWLFRAAPYIYFASMCAIATIIPVISSSSLLSRAADVIVLVGILALARMFLALAAMDIGTAFGDFGARRELLVAFLAEPALLIIFFNFSLISQSTSLTTISQLVYTHAFIDHPSLLFAMVAFAMVLLAENARIPVDNPATHLELTMIHEAMILEYSGKYLALIEWGSALKLLNYFAIGIALFWPEGIAISDYSFVYIAALAWFLLKLVVAGFGLALVETITAKMRLFRIPEFLTSAFVLAIIGVLTYLV